MEYCVFSKSFQVMDAEELGKTLSQMDIDGVDLTVREGGHINPQKVENDLPLFQEILYKYNLKIPMLTTSIVEMNEETKKIVETASRLKIKYIKLGYWEYTGFGHYKEQVKQIKKSLSQLEPLFRDNKIKAGFHTHSGEFMGLNANHVLRLIEDCDPEVIGIYYDIGHNTIEGSHCGWMMDLDLIQQHLFMIAIKDLAWLKNDNSENKKWVKKVVPLGKGLVNWEKFVKCLKQINFNGPVSFHSEYKGPSSWKDLSTQEIIKQTVQDIKYFRSLVNESF